MTGTTASSGDHSIMTGCTAIAGGFLGELAEILGMAGFGEARPVEHVLGDRIGHDRAGGAGADIGDGATDGRKRGRRARLIGTAGLGGDRNADIDNRQRGLEGGAGRMRARQRRSSHRARSARRAALTNFGSARR